MTNPHTTILNVISWQYSGRDPGDLPNLNGMSLSEAETAADNLRRSNCQWCHGTGDGQWAEEVICPECAPMNPEFYLS